MEEFQPLVPHPAETIFSPESSFIHEELTFRKITEKKLQISPFQPTAVFVGGPNGYLFYLYEVGGGIRAVGMDGRLLELGVSPRLGRESHEGRFLAHFCLAAAKDWNDDKVTALPKIDKQGNRVYYWANPLLMFLKNQSFVRCVIERLKKTVLIF